MKNIIVKSALNPCVTHIEINGYEHEYTPTSVTTIYSNSGNELMFEYTGITVYDALYQQLNMLSSLGITLSNNVQIELQHESEGDIVTNYTTVDEILLEANGLDKHVSAASDKEENLFFSKYKELGGAINNFAEYKTHLAVFFLLTKPGCTEGTGLTRDSAFVAWQCYCSGAKLLGNESILFFRSVDDVHAYS